MAYIDPSLFLTFVNDVEPFLYQNLTVANSLTKTIMAAAPEQQKALVRTKFHALRIHLESIKINPHLQQDCFLTIREIAQANLGPALPQDKDDYNNHRQYFQNAADMYNEARPNHNEQWWNNIYNNMWCVRIFVDAVQLYCDNVLR